MRQVLLVALLFTLPANPSQAGSPQEPAPAPVRVGGNIPQPQKIKDVKAVYPAEAQRARAVGVVILEATIGEDGKVRDAVVKRSIPLLDQAALDAVRQWEYTPTIVGGRPVPVIMTVTVNFAIQGVPMPPVPVQQMAATIRLTSMRTQDGVSTVWEIPTASATALPRWNPEAAALSLPISEATRIARTWLTQRNPQVERFELQSITLSRVRRSAEIDFWYYQIDFYAYGTTQQPGGPLFKAVILPDGSIVEPTQS